VLPFASVALPKAVVPSKNMTVPVGVPEVAVTWAVNVTACPYVAGFSEEVTAVVVGFWTDPVLFSNTLTNPADSQVNVHWFTTTKSGRPSPFTSAAATDPRL